MFSDCYGSAFHLDCLRSSHPIEVPVSSPNEIDEIFDEISYSKGSVLINMIHNFIGDEVSCRFKYNSYKDCVL